MEDMKTKTVPCEDCEGRGTFTGLFPVDFHVSGYHAYFGYASKQTVRCATCKGSGELVFPVFYKVGSKFVAWEEEDEPSEETSKDSVGGGDCGEVDG